MLRLGLALERNLNHTERAATTDFDPENAKIAESTAATEDGGWKELNCFAFEIRRSLRTISDIAVRRTQRGKRGIGACKND